MCSLLFSVLPMLVPIVESVCSVAQTHVLLSTIAPNSILELSEHLIELNKLYFYSLTQDRGAQSPKTSQLASLPRDSPINSGATRSPMTTSIGSAASHSRLDTVSTSHESLDLTNIPPEWSAPPEVPPVLTPDANANTNPFFDSPEIRAFLFGTSDSVLGELPSVSTVAKGSSTVAKGSSKAHCAPNSSSAQHNLNLLLHSSPSALLESVVDSPMSISPAGSVAPLASCEDDADLCSPGVS